MPVPMDRQNFGERLEMARQAVGLKFQQPPATQPGFEGPDAEMQWQMLQLIEQLVREVRKLTVE